MFGLNFICRYGGIGRRAWFRLHHDGELAKIPVVLQKPLTIS